VSRFSDYGERYSRIAMQRNDGILAVRLHAGAGSFQWSLEAQRELVADRPVSHTHRNARRLSVALPGIEVPMISAVNGQVKRAICSVTPWGRGHCANVSATRRGCPVSGSRCTVPVLRPSWTCGLVDRNLCVFHDAIPHFEFLLHEFAEGLGAGA